MNIPTMKRPLLKTSRTFKLAPIAVLLLVLLLLVLLLLFCSIMNVLSAHTVPKLLALIGQHPPLICKEAVE